jgi:VWFA-related protein
LIARLRVFRFQFRVASSGSVSGFHVPDRVDACNSSCAPFLLIPIALVLRPACFAGAPGNSWFNHREITAGREPVPPPLPAGWIEGRQDGKLVPVMIRAAALTSVFLLPFSMYAQSLPIFRSDTNVVVVPVTVTDRSGHFVRDLTPAEFEIVDGGVRRPVLQFASERVPVSLAILLDISGSMATDAKTRALDNARWADTLRALELLVERLNPDDEVLFAAFSDRVVLAVPWTRDHQQVPRAFNTLRPAGYTAMFDAVKSIAPVFQRAAHPRRVMLVITDGADSLVPRMTEAPIIRDPSRREQQVQLEIHARQRALRDNAIGATQRAVTSSGAAVYAIGMGTGKGAYVDLPNLQTLTVNSGGYAEAISDPAQITAAVARIFDELQTQYMLAFEPAHADGKYHEISVTTKNKDLRVRARTGYTASESGK